MSSDLFSVEGRVALVSGGSRGIGLMIARGLVEHGARVYITARKPAELEAAAGELAELGECRALCSDLASVDGVRQLAARIAEQEPGLDILVNNAGATWGASVEEFPEAGWDKVMDLNLKSPFFMIQALLPQLRYASRDGRRARVVNIGSVNGISHPHMPNYSYSASKAALHHLTRHLSVDLAADGINVNAIAPGLFPSKMTAHMQSHFEALSAEFPIPRTGRQEDVAAAVIFLASRASDWITGQVLAVDGGAVAAS